MFSLFLPSFSVSASMSNAWYEWIKKQYLIRTTRQRRLPTPCVGFKSLAFLNSLNETTMKWHVGFFPLFGQIKPDRSWKCCLDVTFSVYKWRWSSDVRKCRWSGEKHSDFTLTWLKNYVWNHGSVRTSVWSSFISILHACTHICSYLPRSYAFSAIYAFIGLS